MFFLERILAAGRTGPGNGDEYDAVNTVSTNGEMETDRTEPERLKQRRNAVDHLPSLNPMHAFSQSQKIR